jgi:hypothetical protein
LNWSYFKGKPNLNKNTDFQCASGFRYTIVERPKTYIASIFFSQDSSWINKKLLMSETDSVRAQLVDYSKLNYCIAILWAKRFAEYCSNHFNDIKAIDMLQGLWE